MLQGEELEALDGDREFARFVVEKANLRFRQDEPQTLVLGETSIVVRLWVDESNHYVIRPVAPAVDQAFPGTGTRALKLGQLYASIVAGRLYRPTGPSLARWKRRALAEMGVVPLPTVRLVALPDDAPSYVHDAWEGIGLLVAVRRLVDPEERVLPLCRSFMPLWCGCDGPTWRRSIYWLERNEYVGRAGHEDVGEGKPMTLWWIAEDPS
jgi:hypothetical protein